MPPQNQQQRTQNRGVLERGAILGIKELFANEGLEFNEPDLQTLSLTPPEKPPFPTLIFMMAVGKDLIDMVTIPGDLMGATVIGLIGTFTLRVIIIGLSFVVSVVIFIWVLDKMNRMARLGFGVAKMWIKSRVRQGGVGILVEFIFPYIPFTTIFVLFAHHHENKHVKLLLSAFEQLGRASKSGKIKISEIPPRLSEVRSPA